MFELHGSQAGQPASDYGVSRSVRPKLDKSDAYLTFFAGVVLVSLPPILLQNYLAEAKFAGLYILLMLLFVVVVLAACILPYTEWLGAYLPKISLPPDAIRWTLELFVNLAPCFMGLALYLLGVCLLRVGGRKISPSVAGFVISAYVYTVLSCGLFLILCWYGFSK